MGMLIDPARFLPEATMPITRLLQNAAFKPDEVRELVSAYESVLDSLSLRDRTDPIHRSDRKEGH